MFWLVILPPFTPAFKRRELEIDCHVFCTISSSRYTTRYKYYLSGKLLLYVPPYYAGFPFFLVVVGSQKRSLNLQYFISAIIQNEG